MGNTLRRDNLIGRTVAIRSTGGVVYYGVIEAIGEGEVLGELFTLACGGGNDRRFVYVVDREAQVSEFD
jgi:hypothetical protein